VITQGAVAISDGQIAWAGKLADLPVIHAGLPRTEYGDATILPGLVETHAHLDAYSRAAQPDVPDPERHSPGWETLSSVKIARQLASLGVTTVQSLGARDYTDVALREAVNLGLVDGPRIVAAGPPITFTGGHDWVDGSEIDSIADILHHVREHHKAGTDAIKVMATGGFMSHSTAPWNAQFSTDQLRALIGDAHRLGKHVAAHAHGSEGIRRAVDAGIDYIAHATFIDPDGQTRFDPELADEIAERGIFVDGCAPPSFPPVAGETTTPRAYELYQHGVRIVAGHDIGAVYPASAYSFGLKQLEASGLPRAEVLIAATSRGAAAVGLAGVTGVVGAGYAADLVVVEGDPLASLDALDQIKEVIIFGRSFSREHVPPFDPGVRLAAGTQTRQSPQDARQEWIRRKERAKAHPLPRITA
jgi:imidazolonepropionase-like amidohydrolase